MSFSLLRLLLLLSFAAFLAGCASKPITAFEAGRPALDPLKFFAGRTQSWGVFETPRGQPQQILTTTTKGRMLEGALHFEQDLAFESGRRTHRSWIVRRVDEHRYTATGTGIIGLARGEARGNTFRLDFTLDALPGNAPARVHMTQWLYLQPDGRTLLNRATLRKGGMTVAMITEQFRKER